MASREIKKIIIAGGTQSQKQLLENVGINCELFGFEGMPDLKDRKIENEMLIQEIAHYRGRKTAKQLFNRTHNDFVVIATETAAIFNNKILKVPKTKTQVKRLFKHLSGKTHKIVTGLCVWWGDKGVTIKDETLVTLRKISEEEIEEHAEKGDFTYPGGYCVTSSGAMFIESIEGNYHNLLGLPVNKIYEALEDEFLFRLFQEPDCGVWKYEDDNGGKV